MSRPDERGVDRLRPVGVELGFQHAPAGSCLVEFGATRVACSASIADGSPRWKPSGGWVTAEYAMLPGSTAPRARRQRSGPDGRAKEIERLIGRSLRAVVDLEAVGQRTITVDCDVLDADGGTRTAAITGAWVALVAALRGVGAEQAVTGQVAAISVGIVGGTEVLDLEYVEDVAADVDANVVMTADGGLVEVQATAEGEVFDRVAMDRLLDLATLGCEELFLAQRSALDGAIA